MKISASIYSNKNKSLQQTVKDAELLQVDYLHVDCKDDASIFDDIAFVRSCCKMPIDLHLISKYPEKYYDLIESNAVEWLTLQHEELQPGFRFPEKLNSRIGISLTSDTPIVAFEQYVNQCSFVLFMTTSPGESGGKFDQVTYQRIREFKRLFPEKRIHVDGGVTAEVAFVLKTLGVYCAVSGSFLVCANDMAEALMGLRGRSLEHQTVIKEFMRSLNETPRIMSSEVNLKSLLSAIDRSKMGFVAVLSADGRLEGVVTDGDIRRALLRNIETPKAIVGKDLINRNPITVWEDMTVSQMLSAVRQQGRPILFLPVIGNDNRLVGCINFTEIIKGEL